MHQQRWSTLLAQLPLQQEPDALMIEGSMKDVAIAVRNVSGRRRWSKLNEWLETAMRHRRKSETA